MLNPARYRWLPLAITGLMLPACTSWRTDCRHFGSGFPTTASVLSEANGVWPATSSLPPPAANLPAVPAAGSQGTPLPINLPTALSLSDANPLDIQLAGERLQASAAVYDKARLLWLPNVNLGVDYFRHDGQIQDVAGAVFTTSKSSLLLGLGPTAVFSLSDALYAPLAAKQVMRAREAEMQAVRNDTTLAVAEAYFNVQQARGEVSGSIAALKRAEELIARTEKLAPEITPQMEVSRAKSEAARRRLAVEAAFERWQVAGAELTRLLRLQPGTLVEPAEEPSLTVELIDAAKTAEELIPIALTHRPELEADQAMIQAALARVKREKHKPYLPTLAARGAGAPTGGGLAGVWFGGGFNDNVSDFGPRFSVDLQAVWEFENLGFGNRSARREKEAESRAAMLHLLRTQERITAEVVQSLARVQRSRNRVIAAEAEVKFATETAEKNLLGLTPGKRGPGGELVLIVRPQEAVASVAALDQAYRDYYSAVADQNRAQFQLYRALGHPAQCLTTSPQSRNQE